jgi:hemerythrin
MGDFSMDAIEWNDSYSVGVNELDEQHKKLFRIINTMFSAEDLSVSSKVMTDLIDEMSKYASIHFETEERYLSECNYPELENQIRAHDVFRKKVDELRSAQTAESENVPSEMIRFLYEWLVNHIMFCDKKYMPYISNNRTDSIHNAEISTASSDTEQSR